MTDATLEDLQASVQDRIAFTTLTDYSKLSQAFLDFLERTQPTRIVSPTNQNYIFYQYYEWYGHRITRPLNIRVFFESTADFTVAFERFFTFLGGLRKDTLAAVERSGTVAYTNTNEINSVVYTIQP
jgi:hypothetical protein